MRMITTKQRFLAGLILLLATNLFVLAGVVNNRSGETPQQIRLTERELNLPYSYSFRKENSGVYFRLNWRVYTEDYQYSGYSYYGGRYSWVSWLNEDKLNELGFDTSYPLHEKNAYRVYSDQTEKEVFIVLEYDGDSQRKIIENLNTYLADLQAEFSQSSGKEKENLDNQISQARDNLKEELESRSRLFAIDTGKDLEKLMSVYPERKQYLIVKGRVRISLRTKNNKQQVVQGQITELSNPRIHVPLQFRSSLENILEDRKSTEHHAPRFEADIAWGNRLEPWIVAVQTLALK